MHRKEIGRRVQELYHSQCNSQQNCEGGGKRDMYDHWLIKKIFSLTMNRIFVHAPLLMRRMATCMILGLLIISH